MKEPFEGGFIITQLFGANPDYYKPYGFAGHEGLDLIPKGENWDIMAVEGGVILQDIDASRDNYGIYIVIWNKENKRAWWYCHLSENYVELKKEVKEGERIGKMGRTGKVTGAHLHLGLRHSDNQANPVNLNNGYKGFVDPLPYFQSNSPLDPLQECLKAHKEAVDSASKKDEEIKELKEQIKNLKDADEQAKKQLNSQQDEIEVLRKEKITAEKKLALLQTEMEGKLAKAEVDCQSAKDNLTTRLVKDFEIKEESYKKTISDLEEKVKEKEIIVEKKLKFKTAWDKLITIIEILKTPYE